MQYADNATAMAAGIVLFIMNPMMNNAIINPMMKL